MSQRIHGDSVFIRLKDQPEHYLHPTIVDGDPSYQVLRGLKGAAVFRFKNAQKMIRKCKNQGLENLEYVSYEKAMSEHAHLETVKEPIGNTFEIE